MTKRAALLFLAVFLSGFAGVSHADYKCLPADFKLETSGRTGLHLHGIMNVPVDGYTYQLDPEDADSSPAVKELTLNLLAPAGEMLKKETPLEISADIDTGTDDVKIVIIDVVKEFSSGPAKITCRSADAEKAPVIEE